MDFLVVLLAAVVSFISGGLWFSPGLFYKRFALEMGFSEEGPSEDFNPVKMYGLTFLGEFAIACCLYYLISFSQVNVVTLVLLIAVIVCVSNIKTNQFSVNNVVVYFITEGQKFLSIVLMGVIITVLS